MYVSSQITKLFQEIFSSFHWTKFSWVNTYCDSIPTLAHQAGPVGRYFWGSGHFIANSRAEFGSGWFVLHVILLQHFHCILFYFPHANGWREQVLRWHTIATLMSDLPFNITVAESASNSNFIGFPDESRTGWRHSALTIDQSQHSIVTIAVSYRPTQPLNLSGMATEYRPKCGDGLGPGSTDEYDSFQFWMHR